MSIRAGRQRHGLSTADGGAPGATGIGLLVLLAVVASILILAGPALAAGIGTPGRPSAAEYAEAAELGERHREAEEADAVAEPTAPLNDTEALALAEAAFSPQLEAAAGIFNELEIEQPLTDYAAVVEAPASAQASGWAGVARATADLEGNQEYEGPALLESSVPLQTPDALGLPAPVDLGLEEAGAGLAPANPLAELWIPGELGEGVSLPEAGVRLTFPEAVDSSEATMTPGEALAFYPNAAPETDLALSPTPEGVETFSVLRTAEAPKSTEIDLAMGEGEELRATTDGGAEVLEGGATKLEVGAPHATDAAGAAVPASLAVEGDTITVTAEPTADASYPILLDPPFIENFDSTDGSWKEIKAWEKSEPNPNAMRTIPYSYSQGPSRPGLDMDAGYLPPGPVENPGDQAAWFYYVPRFFSDLNNAKAPPTSFINRMGSSYVDLETFGDHRYSPQLQGGIWLENVGWISPETINGTEGDRLTSWYFTNPNADRRARVGIITLQATEYQSPPGRRNAYIDKIFVETADGEAPGAGPAFGPTEWVNQTAKPISYNVTDTGLGVKSLKVVVGGKVSETSVPIATGSSTPCKGTSLIPCPRQAGSKVEKPNVEIQPYYNPAELTATGEYTATYTATDPVGNVSSAKPFTLKVDHTNPVVALSGSLTEQAAIGDGLNEYTLNYTATDGTASAPQSGVKSVEVKVDGKTAQSEAPGCATKNCPLTGKWILDASQFSYGKHTVEVVATDAVGRKSTLPSFQIELLDVRQGPIAAYPLDEGTNRTVHDVSGNGHEGTLSATGFEWAPGKYGKGVKFNGSEGCISIPDSAALRLREEFTLESWVKPEGTLSHLPILYKAGESFPAYDLGIGLTTSGRGEGQIGTTAKSHTDAATPAAMEANVWQHLAVTYDGAYLRLYLNGKLVTTKAVSGPNSAVPGGALMIGCSPTYHFKGKIDEVRIYNRAILGGEVEADQATPIQTPQAGPVATYPLDEGEGTLAHDATGNAHLGFLSTKGAEWAPGKYGGGLRFDGKEGCVSVPDSLALRLGEEFTLESWVKPEGELFHDPAIYKEVSGENFPSYALGVGLTIPTRPEGQIGTEAKGHADAVAPSALEANVWSDLALTYDGAKLRLYVNGELAKEMPVEKTNSAGPGTLKIGCATTAGDYFKGRIDEVRIYNRALAKAEVQADQSTPIQTPQANPVAAYPLDEGSGLVAHDASGNAHEGALSAEGVEWVPGKYGKGLKFDGAKGCVSIPDSPQLRLGEEFTLESWVKPEFPLSHDPVIYKEAAGEGFPSYALGIAFNTTGKPEGQIGREGKTHQDIASNNSLEANVWYHLALSYDGVDLRLYVNGELKKTQAVVAPNSASPGPLTIGCAALTGSHFKGRIDEVRIYNRALNLGEVQTDQSTPIQAPQAAPVAAYPLDEGSGTVAHDASGNAHEGTLSAKGAEWAPGKYGNALKFNGTEGCVSIPDSAALRLGEEFTLESWVRPESPLSHMPAIYKEAAGEGFPSYALVIGFNTAGKPEGQLGREGKTHQDIAAENSVEANVWSHLALTYDGVDLRLYVNGVLEKTQAVVAPNSASPGPLSIGCAPLTGSHFKGRIDEVRIYNRALAGGEVQADQSTPIQAPQTAPVAAYGLNAGEGTLAHDDSGNAHEGTLSAKGAEWVPGKYGNALKFNGTEGCVSIPDSVALRLGEEFTLESWVRPEGTLTHLPILYKAGEGFPAYDLGVGLNNTESKGEGQIGTTAKSHTDTATPKALEANVWQHLAVTYDGAKLQLYLNGTLVDTEAVSGPNSAVAGALSIGCGGGYHFKGRIDEVRIYNRALSTGEIAADQSAPIQTPNPPNPGGYQTPIASYPFDEGAGTTTEDATGDNHTATIEGAEWTAKGKYGAALKFNGTNSCVSIADAGDLRLSEEFTLESWVRPEGAMLHYPAIFKQGSESSRSYSLGIGFNTAGKPEGELAGQGKAHQDLAALASLEPNLWSHLALTYDGAKLRLYVNGELVATKAVLKPPTPATAGPLTIGCARLTGSYFKGRIDEVRIYNRALGAGEVNIDQGVAIQTPAAAPIAAYPFDEGTGTVAGDASGNLHEGTLSAEGVEWSAGKYGSGLKFDGTKGCVSIPDSEALRLGEEFTLESWVKPEGSMLHYPTIYKESSEGFPSYSLGIGFATAGRPEGQLGKEGKSHQDLAATASLEAGVWSHLALTYDGTKLRLYVNGELAATKYVLAPDSATPGPLTIGCAALTGYHFKGRIDEVRIYNRAIGLGEVAADQMTPIQTPQSNPIADYPFDENEGTTAHDASGNPNPHEGTLSGEGVEWAPGKYGSGLKFEGTNGCVSIPDSTELQLGEEFTLESWVNPEGELAQDPAIFKESTEGSSSYDLGIGFNSVGKPEGQIGKAGKAHQDIAAGASLEPNVWSHLALTYDGAKLRLYVDGTLAATKYVLAPISQGSGPLTIGCGGGSHFKGRIDEVRIYNRALDGNEVAIDGGVAIQTPAAAPVAAYPFDENEGTVAHDSSGNKNEGTFSAEGVSWAPGKYGSALQFDGANGCLSIPDSEVLRLGEEFSLESWVRPEGEMLHYPAIYKESSEGFPSYALGIGFNTAGKPEGQLGKEGKGHQDLAATASLEPGVWSHLALTYDGAKLRLYVNGELAATKYVEAPASGTPGPLTIGCAALGAQRFKGRIDEVRIYNRAIGLGEVAADEGAPIQTPQTGPIAAYPLEEGEGTVAHDATGNLHEGALSAEGVTWAPGKYGEGLAFDGAKGCVTIPDSPALRLREEFTLESWVKPEGELTHLPILYKAGEGFAAYDLGIGLTTPGKGEGQIGNLAKSHIDATSPTRIEGNVWQHLAVTYDGASLRLYLNGSLVATKEVTEANSGVPGALTIGCGGSYHFRGRIDELRIYNRALGAGEVADSLAASPQVSTAGTEGVSESEAVMTALVNPMGQATSVSFEYGLTTSYGSTYPTFAEEWFSGLSVEEIQQAVDELNPETTYHYRAIVTSELGRVVGLDRTFKTSAPEIKAFAFPSFEGSVGVNWSGDRAKTQMNLDSKQSVAQSGAQIFRFVLNTGVGTGQAQEQNRNDDLFKFMAEHQITILPDISGIAGRAKNRVPNTKQEPGGTAKYLEGLKYLAERYGPGGDFWKSHSQLDESYAPRMWEIWNEENFEENAAVNGVVDPVNYGRLLGMSHAVLEEINSKRQEKTPNFPAMKVLFGGLLTVGKSMRRPTKSGVPESHLTTSKFIKDAGHTEDYAAVSLHPYAFLGNDAVVTRRVKNNIKVVRNTLDHHGGKGKKLWITEIGWPIEAQALNEHNEYEPDQVHRSVSEMVQQSRLNSVFDMIKSHAGSGTQGFDIANITWYNDENTASTNWASNCGLVDINGKRRPSFEAFQSQAK